MDYTIHDLPEMERPREKLRELGAGSLTDVELLAIVLRTGTQGKNVKELAGEILNTYSVADLANRTLTDLCQFEGVSEVKAGQLRAVGELATRLQREDRDRIASLSDVSARVGDMRYFEDEELRVFHLSSGNELLHEERYRGSVDAVDFRLRDVFRDALRQNAAAIILAHNHPSGASDPTPQDRSVTREAVNLGERLGIAVLDHVIVGEETTSVREQDADLFH